MALPSVLVALLFSKYVFTLSFTHSITESKTTCKCNNLPAQPLALKIAHKVDHKPNVKITH